MSEENLDQTKQFESPDGHIYTIGVDSADADSVWAVTTHLNMPPTLTFSNDTDTGIYVDGSGSLSFSTGGATDINFEFDVAGVKVNRTMIREYLESQYITNKITKEELVNFLKKYYNEAGLDIAETLENMEVAKENFIKKVKETT